MPRVRGSVLCDLGTWVGRGEEHRVEKRSDLRRPKIEQVKNTISAAGPFHTELLRFAACILGQNFNKTLNGDGGLLR